MSNVKGSAFASRIKWTKFNHGEEGLSRLQTTASPDLGKILQDGAVMSSWYPFELFVEINELIDSTFGKGDYTLVKGLGRHGADANLTTIYRLFYKVGTVKWILARAARLWGMHYDTGRLLVTQAPGNEAELRIEGFEPPHRVHCLSVQGWAERSVELSGGRNVALDELTCRASGDDTCRFRITWH